jgi:UPF0755 protein
MFFKRLVWLILLFILLVGLAAAAVWRHYQQFLQTPLSLPADGLVLVVERGVTLKRLAHDLAERAVLDQPDYFYWYGRQRRQAHLIQAGEYAVPADATPSQLFDLLVSGETIKYTLTLVEGWNFRQVMAAIRADPVLRQTLEGLENAQIMQRLGYADQHPEGRFFPDTYHFPRGATDIQLLQRAYQRMQKIVAGIWPERAPDIAVKTPEEALILASIVEKETGKPEERTQIAGVFTRRLKMSMKLQTDPTVIYGMGERYDGNIRRRDLREDTPYNTYVHKGLPPTPICMPGRDAIYAAVHPAAGDTLYFVAKGDGAHQFSATLREHNRAVRKYQLKR